MPGQITFALDDLEFQKTMSDYITYAGKEAAFAMNRTMNNLAVIGYQETDLAQSGEIEAVQSLDWWPRYVAKVMKNRKAAQLVTRIEKTRAKGKQMRQGTYARLAKLHYTRAEARKMSASMIRRRSVAIGFVRFFFVTLSRRVREYTPGVNTPASKSFKGFNVSVSPATMQDPRIAAEVTYSYRSRGEKSVQKAEQLLQDSLDAARPKLIADMKAYIANKVAQIPHSMRRRAA